MNIGRGLYADFVTATSVLTRLPVGDAEMAPGGIAAAGWAFPLVGAGVGALAGIAFFSAELLGCAPGVAALIAVGTSLAVTGAFHEDGLADTVDGFGGGRTREAKLAIMRDSRHGTFGILALIFSIAFRGTALAEIGDPIHAGLALIAAHSFSRGALPLLMRLMAPARPDGIAATAGRPSPTVALVAAAIGIALGPTLLGPGAGLAAGLVTIGALALAAMLAQRQIGGYTGDVLGFFQQIGEIVMLLAAAR